MPDVTTTESIVRQAPFLEDFQRRLLTSTFEDLQPADIPGVTVAGLQPLQQQAILRAQEGIGVQDPFIQAGLGSLGTSLETLQSGLTPLQTGVTTGLGSLDRFDPSQIAQFMDPFQQGATDVGLQELARQADIRRNTIGAEAAGVGAFGGARQGIAEAELDRNLLESQRRLLQTDLSRNFTQALGASQTAFENQQRRQQGLAQTLGQLGKGIGDIGGDIGALGVRQAGLGELAQQTGQQDVNVLSQLGGQQQAVQQQVLDAARQTELQRQGEPFQRFGFLSDVLRGVPSSASTFTTATAPSVSPLSTLLGAGAAITGLGGLFRGSGVLGGNA
jgi:hypothetical protein|tara:strand:+ start:1297 stop:2292 length:996 start_codon:yes stop_codon:yes gene_type:complete